MYRYRIFLLLLICGSCLGAFGEPLAGVFKMNSKTFYNYRYSPSGGIKLKNGDVLLYDFDHYKKEKNGAYSSGGLNEDVPYYKLIELYRSKTKTFEAAPKTNYFHLNPETVLLNDGRVLLAGAFCPYLPPKFSSPMRDQICEESAHVEIYDPVLNKFTIGASMLIPRAQFGMTLLKDGRVLFEGGAPAVKQHLLGDARNITVQAEIYDPKTDRFTFSGRLVSGKDNIEEIAITLDSGDVLVIENRGQAEIFDSQKAVFRRIQGLNEIRGESVAIKLLDGRVLIFGGTGQRPFGVVHAEIFDPKTETFKTVKDMITEKGADYKSAVLLKDGKVLITGGGIVKADKWFDVHTEFLNSAEIFNPTTERFYSIGNMKKRRVSHKSFLLDDGNVLIIGGSNAFGYVRNSEFYLVK